MSATRRTAARDENLPFSLLTLSISISISISLLSPFLLISLSKPTKDRQLTVELLSGKARVALPDLHPDAASRVGSSVEAEVYYSTNASIRTGENISEVERRSKEKRGRRGTNSFQRAEPW